jgi:hypothetical protein
MEHLMAGAARGEGVAQSKRRRNAARISPVALCAIVLMIWNAAAGAAVVSIGAVGTTRSTRSPAPRATAPGSISRTRTQNQMVLLHRVLADWGEGTSDAPEEEGQGAAAMPGDAT